jgi:hypothetical protein
MQRIHWKSYLLPSFLGWLILLSSAATGVWLPFGIDQLWIFGCVVLVGIVFVLAIASVFDLVFNGLSRGWVGAIIHVHALVPASCLLFLLCHGITAAILEEQHLRRAEAALASALVEAAARCASEPADATFRVPERFVADCGPPLRIAFRYEGGFLDNWSAAVYDPSHAMGSIRLPGGTIQDHPHPLRSLFGGDVVECQRMRSDFYRCRWT